MKQVRRKSQQMADTILCNVSINFSPHRNNIQSLFNTLTT